MDPWTDRLSDYIDDELAAAERAELEQHLAGCEACRRTVAELRAVTARAASLAAQPPAADLWPGIEARLGATRQPRRTLTFSMPQLAAAAIVLVALTSALVWSLRKPEPAREPVPMSEGRRPPATGLPVSFADETYDRAVADLERALTEGRGRLDPETIAVIERNLAAVDAAIAQARRALEADPSNTYLYGHVADARRRKLALLRRVSALADPEG